MRNDADNLYMRRCLELAGNALGRTWPNPVVGSVIVHEGRIIAKGTPAEVTQSEDEHVQQFLRGLPDK